MTLAIDTNVLSAYFKNDPAVVELIARQPEIYLPVVVRAEVMAGFYGGAKMSENMQQFANFTQEVSVEVLHITIQTTDIYARLHASLRQKGRPIPINDLWIAALCLEHNCTLATRDSDFEAIELLPLISGRGS